LALDVAIKVPGAMLEAAPIYRISQIIAIFLINSNSKNRKLNNISIIFQKTKIIGFPQIIIIFLKIPNFKK
jgi:hypothetical protein